ncbi:hypothetical protein [Desulfobulbus alkaliphilus]|uniref:hypothetical protein n=1 Tax=Desulfobulbus alkaliphilus TaxID=869814 RepID=UPI00196637A9|nr:hypothetical protein [Desulfobulbus alkaliphilus]MBM9537545.1 hypothetical protein [Desulfobulbus alkaliphilus]
MREEKKLQEYLAKGEDAFAIAGGWTTATNIRGGIARLEGIDNPAPSQRARLQRERERLEHWKRNHAKMIAEMRERIEMLKRAIAAHQTLYQAELLERRREITNIRHQMVDLGCRQ